MKLTIIKQLLTIINHRYLANNPFNPHLLMFKVQFIPQLGTASFEPTQGLRGVLLLMRRHREQCTPRGPGASGFGPRGLLYHGKCRKITV